MEGKTANVDLIQSNGFGIHTRYLLHSLEFGELSESKKIDFPKEKHLVFNQCGRDHFSLHLKFWNPFSIIPGKEFNRDILAVAHKPLPTLRAYWRFCAKTIQVEAGGVLLRIVDYLGRERVAYGGTFGGMWPSKIQSLIAGRLQDADEETILQSKDKLQKIKSSEGMMPGRLLLLPEGMHFCDITPLRKLEEPTGKVEYVTHMQGWHLWTVLSNISVIGSGKLEQLFQISQAAEISSEMIDHQETGLCVSAASC